MKLTDNLFLNFEMNERVPTYLTSIIMIIVLTLICVVANFITTRIILRLTTHLIRKSKFKWGNAFLERKLLHKLSHIVPAVIIYYFASFFPSFKVWIERMAHFYIVCIVIVALNTLLNAVNDIYQEYEISKVRPIKGIIQILKIVVFIVGGITLIAILKDKNPLLLLGGLGALSAVLMLIFKDSILGFVAGVQLASNDMVRVGDWIEMPKYDADGEVIDIALNTVKVQNWDKTITMIPSYAFISDSFKNWRGMQDTGGRRIMRSIYIDTTSIQFCTKDMLEDFKKIHHLTEYIEDKEKEIEEYNRVNNGDGDTRVNGRHLTNVGTFRIYIYNYLKSHQLIHKELPIIVRQLEPAANGLPMQIYCFTNDTRWEVYEAIQADIFDHILSVVSEFNLRIFQNPSGHDLRSFSHK